ncbi:unnamed protein product [Rotaria magnacalcarata]|uniref:Uncharacterized protein n=1 Tax=Rotaria magnacalcarata TaxID=392030 RepID=A0A819HCW5_9BILA|nr:unnamed protein product [Rotaria magnacalcarata]CAF2113250.1 unnamed protein product [Rotaria magnacalcarata]CAF3779362.1 unnamed protein product [Rotaria magnacalcarata]CAF3895007.1 unnamed protein product [Rotaria magnacalcarata]
MYDVESYLHKQIDDSWIALLVIAILILISSIITITVLCLLWRRHQQRIQVTNENPFLNNKSNRNRPLPVQQFNHCQARLYETQKLQVFIPPSMDDTTERSLDEIHTRFKPRNDSQYVHQFCPSTSKAYF